MAAFAFAALLAFDLELFSLVLLFYHRMSSVFWPASFWYNVFIDMQRKKLMPNSHLGDIKMKHNTEFHIRKQRKMCYGV